MTFDAELKDFYTDDPQRLVDDPLRFKAKLHIGDDAFQVLSSFDTFNTMIGAGSAGAAIASSSYIASAFLAKVYSTVSGWWQQPLPLDGL